jgi:chromosome segregation ATPase
MNRFFLLLIAVTLTGGAVAQQSLGDVARQTRAQQKPAATVHLDNDTLPSSSMGRISTASSEATPEEIKTNADQTGKTSDGKDQEKKDVAAAEKAKPEDWNKKLDEQRKEIATLQRELDILQREQRLRAAAFYADAGTRLRDQGKFSADSREEQEQIDAKKQALDAAQQKLADLQEQARKAGASTE